MSDPRHLVVDSQEDGTFYLRMNGQTWRMKFPDLESALDHAFHLGAAAPTRLTVYDLTGQPIIETFPAWDRQA